MSKLVLYKTNETFSDIGIVENTPCYRTRAGHYCVVLGEGKDRVARKLINRQGQPVSSPHNVGCHIGDEWNRTFEIRNIQFTQLKTYGLPDLDMDEQQQKIFTHLCLIIDDLQSEIATLTESVVNLTSAKQTLQGQVDRIFRKTN